MAGKLTAARTRAAVRLGTVVTSELASLAMPHATLTIAVTQSVDERGLPVGDRSLRFGPTGVDDVELLLAANRGAEPATARARVPPAVSCPG